MATAMTPAQQGAPCAHDHEDDHRDDEYSVADLAFDPTLASCCERDEHEYKKAMQLKAVLTAHDRTSGAVRMRQQLFQPPVTSSATPPPPVVAPSLHVSESDSDFDDSDDEFGVEALLVARRKQIQQAAQDAADGYGVVLDAALSQLVQELQNEPQVPRVALVMDSSASGFVRALRGEMAAVARRFLGSKFYVAMASSDDELRQLRLSSAPCLAAFRRGECVASIALDPKVLVTELEVLWEARFLPWLVKCNALTSERQAAPKRRSTAKKVVDEETDPSGFDCGVEGCRLRFGYEHEHVGTSQQTKDEMASWRQTSA